MSIEAMKQALEALENKRHEYRAYQAITALRLAIEQAEKQEPVAWWNGENSGDEGADFMYPESIPDRSIGSEHTKILKAVWHIPLYTAPPRKEWVGLTELEIAHGLEKANLPAIFSYRAAARAGIDAFKEKNGG